jgi:hypothetical protein
LLRGNAAKRVREKLETLGFATACALIPTVADLRLLKTILAFTLNSLGYYYEETTKSRLRTKYQTYRYKTAREETNARISSAFRAR